MDGGAIFRPEDQSTVQGVKVARYCLAIASAATAVIHFAVTGEHFAEYWLFGLFMLVVAWLQVLWAVAVIARPARWVLWCGAILNAGVIVIYIVTRTVGDVLGPTPHAVEPLGFGDGLCTVLEAAVVAGCCWLLASRNDWQVRREQLVAVPAVSAVAAVVLLSVALVACGPEMVMSAQADAGPVVGGSHAMRMGTSLRMGVAPAKAVAVRFSIRSSIHFTGTPSTIEATIEQI